MDGLDPKIGEPQDFKVMTSLRVNDFRARAVACARARHVLRATAVFASLLAPGLAPAARADEGTEVVELRLDEKPVVVIDGVAGPRGHYFVMREMALLQPITVTLVGARRSEVAVAVVKDAWDAVEREASSRDGRPCELRFRTEGDVGLVVWADHFPSQFRLAVSVSDAVAPPALTPMERPGLLARLAAGSGVSGRLPEASSPLSLAYLLVGSAGVLLLAGLAFVIWRGQK